MTQLHYEYDIPKGTVLLSLQQILQFAFSFIFYVVVARILTRSEVGQISLLAFIMSVFTVVTQLSLPTAATRFIAERVGAGKNREASAIGHTTLKLLILISAPALLVSYIISPNLSTIIFGQTELNQLLPLTFISAFILDLTTLYGAQLLGLGLYSKMVLQNIVYIPLSRSLGLILAYTGLKVTGIVLGWLIAALITLAASLILVRGRFEKASSFPSKILISYSLPLLAFALIGIIQGWADLTLLYAFTSNLPATGTYYIVISSASVFSILWAPLTNAIFPALSSRYGKEGATTLQNTLVATIRLINTSIIPLSIAAAAVSPLLLQLAYGEAYTNGALPFSIIASTIILQAYTAFILITLQAIGRTTLLLSLGAASAAIEILALAFMAKPFGAAGASIARTLLFATTVILGYLYLRKDIQLKFTPALAKSLAMGISIAIPLGITDFYLAQYISHALVIRGVTTASLFISLFVLTARRLQILHNSDFNLLRQAFSTSVHRPINLAEKLLVHP